MFVVQAIETYEAERLKQLEYVSRPLGNLGSLVARVAGVKSPDTAWFNEFELIKRKQTINELFPPDVAQFYLDLREKQIVPAWVDDVTDLEKMKLAAIK